MTPQYERRHKTRRKVFEVIDVELAFPFTCETERERDYTQRAIESMGHRAIVKEVEL